MVPTLLLSMSRGVYTLATVARIAASGLFCKGVPIDLCRGAWWSSPTRVALRKDSSVITTILPCAGKGTRLGLPYPKELHRIAKDQSLIDFSLAHALNAQDHVDKVVTVVAPGKENVGDYAESRLNGSLRLERVYFNEAYVEWPGSIKSAEMHFGAFNVALLPDSVLRLPKGERLMQRYQSLFDDGADLVFAYVPQTDPQVLKALGALQINDSTVTGFCDKPDPADGNSYDGFWASFGFSRAAGAKVLDFMMRSVARQTVDINELSLDVRGFEIESYTELGTWPSMARFLGSDRVLGD